MGMSGELRVSIGQHSDKGVKETNQDFHGALVPRAPLLHAKGIAVAIADGISSSKVSHVASESTVKSLLSDYYCTSEAWSVKTSASRVISATNSWLHAQTRRSKHGRGMDGPDMDKGYVCTLSAVIFKSATAHVFHVGDSRIYRLAGNALEQLTHDHRLQISAEQSYLSRAMGFGHDIEVDYQAHPIAAGDLYILATDGVYEFVGPKFVIATLATQAGDLDAAARLIVEKALANGSGDNLTVQLIRIEDVPTGDAHETIRSAETLPLPPLLEARQVFDGFRIERQLHASSRSHLYLATDLESQERAVIKIPSVDLREDAAYLKRLMMEDWIARRIDSAHVLKAAATDRKKNYLYTVSEWVDGQTLRQWMTDNPHPPLERVRDIIEQIARGLQAFHRKEMLHQDLRPENIMIDGNGTVKIIDFGSARVAGVDEGAFDQRGDILGTVQYTAPEYFLGTAGTNQSDQFSLGVIAYEMLTGRLPYGARLARAQTRAQQRRLHYTSALDEDHGYPLWIDRAIEKAVSIDPFARYAELFEFIQDLRVPNQALLMGPRPLLERNPLLFWKLISLGLFFLVVILAFRLAAR